MEFDRHELDGLLGRQVLYRDRTLHVVEILPEEPALVLAEPMAEPSIQANQFGEASRRAPRTWTVPVFSTDGSDFHPLMKELQLL
jgi:hypothetical protein